MAVTGNRGKQLELVGHNYSKRTEKWSVQSTCTVSSKLAEFDWYIIFLWGPVKVCAVRGKMAEFD